MTLITDILLIAASFGAALYCNVLSRRLRRFNTLESGMGGAIAVLSTQVDGMTRAFENAQAVAGASEKRLATLTTEAGVLARRLELLVASLHDLPEGAAAVPAGKMAPPAAGRPLGSGKGAADSRRPRVLRRRVGRVMEAAE